MSRTTKHTHDCREQSKDAELLAAIREITACNLELAATIREMADRRDSNG